MTENERRYFVEKVEGLDERISELDDLLTIESRPIEVYEDDLQHRRELNHIRSESEHRLIGQQALFDYETPEVA